MLFITLLIFSCPPTPSPSFPPSKQNACHDCQRYQCLPLSQIIVSSLVQDEKVAVAKAKDFLESNTYSAEDPYTTALSAYALALLRSPYAPLALRRLNHMAITQGPATHTVPSTQPVSHWRFMRPGIVN